MKYTYILKTGLLSLITLLTVSCEYNPYDTDIEPVKETMTLECSNQSVAINENDLTADVLSFTWSEARELSDEYNVIYKAELDVLGNNFGSQTVITSGIGFDYRYNEEAGIYTATFTSEQLNNWFIERWKLPVNKNFTLEFRVVAQWNGGKGFESPEVRKITVNVKPIQVVIFDADEMSIGGNVIPTPVEIFKTLENENVYAWKGTLSPGELQIPVQFGGNKYYIRPADGNTEITDGTPMSVKMDDAAGGWNIAEHGEYRVVINMADKTVTIYSAATDLKPLKVDFHPNGEEYLPIASLEVTDLYAFGGGTGWGIWTLNLVPSLADPQVLIFDGRNNAITSLGGDMKFAIAMNFKDCEGNEYNLHNCYCLTNPLTEDGNKQNVSVDADKLFYLHGGSDLPTRDSYLIIPGGTNFIIFDLRNMTLYATTK